jgi:hypothetical protein
METALCAVKGSLDGPAPGYEASLLNIDVVREIGNNI